MTDVVSATGDVLNALAVGALFPLCLLPLAAAISPGGKLAGLGVWAGLTALMAAAVWLFGRLAVDLSTPTVSPKSLLATGIFFAAAALALARQSLETFADAVARVARRLTVGAGQIALIFVVAMAAIQFTVVVMRYVFGVNFILLQESITYLHGAVFLMASGYALLTNDHVRVDIFYADATPRRRALIDFIGVYVFLFPFALATLFLANEYVAGSWAVREGSTEQSGIQGVFLLKSLIPVFAVLLSLAGVAVATDALKQWRTGQRQAAS